MTEDHSQLAFFNQPVSAIFRPNIATCTLDTPVHKAAEKMSRNNTSAILVKDAARNISGIVTDADLRKKVLAKNRSGDTPVSRVMSSPVVTISTGCQVFEAFLTMIRQDKRHLAVRGESGDISGIITEKDLITAQTKASYLLLKSITAARTMADLENIHDRLCRMLLGPIDNGVNPEVITRLITTFSDAILEKIMTLSLAETGPAPCEFVFLTMGSEGREEQTLVSDQDNAIVYADPASDSEAAAASDYFSRLAGLVCSRLDRAGYRFCDGDNMAQNPKWCQPLSVWKQYFHTWIRKAKPEDLLHASIFFDFKGTYGNLSLSGQLKDYLFEAIQGWSGFLRNMTENALHFRPPIGLFGKLKVESRGEHKNAMDIKYAMLPITDVTRVYALKHSIRQTNTLGRLFRLYTRHAITAKEYQNLIQSYNYLMKLRFTRQITNIMDEGTPPDNYINPDNLTHLDRHMLKEIFKTIESFQQKLNMEFTGVV
jgi:CBS domain-containing protein